MQKRRILSIDGGGIKGVFPASFLAQLESALHLSSVGSYFDLIAGTSVGGIIALGFGLGLSAREIARFFTEKGPTIFPRSFFPPSKLRALCGVNRYKHDDLRRALADVFKDNTLAESKARLIVPSFDATSGDIHIYKTRHERRLGMDHNLTAVEVAMATAAAPTYFPAYDSRKRIALIDGGLWANNPVAIAVVEAIGLGWVPNEIDVLTLGCTDEPVDFKEHGHSLFFWASKAIQAAMRGQSRSAIGMARHLTRRTDGSDGVVRVDPVVAPGRFALDDTKGLSDLQGFAYSEARTALPLLKDRFFSVPAEAFTPYK